MFGQDELDHLLAAVKLGDVRRVAGLLHAGADVNGTDDAGYGALHWAVYRGDAAMVDFLIAWPGADINRIDRLGYSVLSAAVAHGYTDIVAALVASASIDVDAAPDGLSALWAAVALNDRDLAAVLLTKADPDAKSGHEGLTVRDLADGSGRFTLAQAGLVDIRFGIDRAVLWQALVDGHVIAPDGTITKAFRQRRWSASVTLPPPHASHAPTVHDLADYCANGDCRTARLLKRRR